MERFTVKNKQFNDYSVAENLRQLDIRDYIYNINQKMGKYEDLEEEIGCSLEKAIDVLKTLCKYMSIDTDSADCDDGSYTFEYIDFGGEALQIDTEEDTQKVIEFINNKYDYLANIANRGE